MKSPEYSSQYFISQFPEFKNAKNIDVYIDRALLYISPYSCLCKDRKQYVVFLLTAHFMALQNNIENGENSGGIQTGASIDKVSVSVAPPPFSDGFDYWLNQTIYGQTLLAFIEMMTPLPGYIGGSFTRVLR